MSFKIVALEVLDSCDSKHSKNLKKNTPYVFYKNYKIKRKDNNETIELVSEDFDLYSKDSKPKINISAIVGKNGSGKSTLVELLIKGINNFFYKYKEDNPISEYHITNDISGVAVNIFYKIENDIFKLKIFENNFNKIEYDIYKGEWDFSNKKWSISTTKNSFFTNMDSFFYTEIINYSLYAFNSKIEGNWISKLFHKNDAYQTPVVLNPWRDNGIININKENELIYQRLLANLFRYNSLGELNLGLGDNLEATFLKLKLSDLKYYEKKSIEDFGVKLSQFEDNFRNDVLEKLFNTFYNYNIKSALDEKLLQHSKLYIMYKLISICHKYDEYGYNKYFDFQQQTFKNLDGLISLLKEDKTHITFKLRQILNFLVNTHIPFDISKKECKIEIKSLAQKIKNVSKHKNIINYLPPPIFKTDIELRSVKSNENEIKFSTLSSGEKQQIYTTSAIYYHLINLESVKNSIDKKKISYKYINVILEEIELYFHPEYQRVFINRLVEGIKNLNLINIKCINLIFVTHSPFILSDIPNSNIMYLKMNTNGYSENINKEKKSFASNIHHLLGDNFFFESIYIGELAYNKINSVIEFIKSSKQTEREDDIKYHYRLIGLIDEPILKNKLTEMLFEKFPDFHKQMNIDNKKKMVEAYAKQMGVEIEIKKS